MFSVYVYTNEVSDGHYIVEQCSYEEALDWDREYSHCNFSVIIHPSD